MAQLATIQLSDFCKLFDVDDRQVRYILEEGFVPKGVEHSPSTGNRREFGPGHAFWLAIILKLKQTGIKTPLAADVADFANRELRVVTQNLSWDWQFLPATGRFDTEHQYFLDIGDLRCIRLVTDSYPSKEGLYQFDWSPVKKGQGPIEDFEPFVVLRVDLTKIAKVLAQVQGWSQSRPC
jgi:hypothetical protein